MKNLIATLLLLLAGAGTGRSQSNAAYGEIRGTISDLSGAVIQNAQITIISAQNGLTRSVLTDDTGAYRFLLVPPGTYSVRSEYTGFRADLQSEVQVTVGETVVIDSVLQIDAIGSNITVLDRSPAIDYAKSQQSDTIREMQIRNLPIDRRTYLSFTLLAPGTADSNGLADNTDFRVVQTAHSGISFYGSNGRGNSITVDGAEANDAYGGVRPTLSQEAVQEFQINRSNYSAELGGASGGVINIVSRSGSNNVSGNIFGFFRHHRLDAADPFAVQLNQNRLERVKPPANRQQYGGTLGFPIRRNRTFVFGSFERLDRHEFSSVPVLTDVAIP